MTAGDRRFVVPTWALGAKWRGLTKDERFRRVDLLLADEGTRVVVLAAGATVHAWAAGIGTRLHYAYVPPELRRKQCIERGDPPAELGRQVITKLLGGYPDVIQITHPWPWSSERFRFTPPPRMRTAA